jgi:hypothetical protein
MAGGCWKETRGISPYDRLRGEMTFPEKSFFVSWFLRGRVDSKKSGNACDSDTQLRWSPPGVARESHANSGDDANAPNEAVLVMVPVTTCPGV